MIGGVCKWIEVVADQDHLVDWRDGWRNEQDGVTSFTTELSPARRARVDCEGHLRAWLVTDG
jgi:hypothetical protein